MKKRFRTRNNKKYLKYIIILTIIIASSYKTYYYYYNKYIASLDNKEIITYIINNTKNNKFKGTLLEKYLNPQNIIKNNLKIKNNQSITVENQIAKSPLIYIYSTHETESYQDKYLEIYNIKPTVKTMSLILQDYLNELNIKTIVENKSISGILKENNWAYKKSYQASRIAISETIINNPSLKMIIDLHRDSSSLEKTLLEYNNKKYARILFVVGEDHSNYQENLALSENLKNILEEKIPNITRGITIKGGDGVNGIYNQDLSNKSILIELGGQYNEIEELNNTLEILSKSIQTYIEGENEKLN
jgi:stage II sporulation protein P